MRFLGIVLWGSLLGLFVAVSWFPINLMFGNAWSVAVYGAALGGSGVFLGYVWGRCWTSWWDWWNV